jgi:uncharacterized small protein (DUF1192 family)
MGDPAMAIDEEEFAARAKPPRLRNLDPMSVEDLAEYIADLEAEIERVRAAMESKKNYLQGVETLFKK